MRSQVLFRLHIMLWTLHLVLHKKRIKLLANPVSHVNLLHCLNFWQALDLEGFNCFWEVQLFC